MCAALATAACTRRAVRLGRAGCRPKRPDGSARAPRGKLQAATTKPLPAWRPLREAAPRSRRPPPLPLRQAHCTAAPPVRSVVVTSVSPLPPPPLLSLIAPGTTPEEIIDATISHGKILYQVEQTCQLRCFAPRSPVPSLSSSPSSTVPSLPPPPLSRCRFGSSTHSPLSPSHTFPIGGRWLGFGNRGNCGGGLFGSMTIPSSGSQM